jgi:hypothetical protein
MRVFARVAAAWLAIAAGAALADPAVTAGTLPAAVPATLPWIVVGFANETRGGPPFAGTTGSRYAGEGYRVAQSAQRHARTVAAAYSLREVASWPVKPLSMHCVVFEITNGRPVDEVLAALSKDPGVMLAQRLQVFHTLTDSEAAQAGYSDPLYDP